MPPYSPFVKSTPYLDRFDVVLQSVHFFFFFLEEGAVPGSALRSSEVRMFLSAVCSPGPVSGHTGGVLSVFLGDLGSCGPAGLWVCKKEHVEQGRKGKRREVFGRWTDTEGIGVGPCETHRLPLSEVEGKGESLPSFSKQRKSS